MSEQHILSNGPLLNENGDLNEAGYATSLVKTYKRDLIKAGSLRIKEWDYYLINDEDYGVALTIADNSYMALMSVSVLDFKNKKEWTKSYIEWFTKGSIVLPETSVTGDVTHKNDKFDMNFYNSNGKRHLVCYMKNVGDKIDFSCDIELTETTPYSMVIATPFKKKAHFYYNQKINLLSAKGTFSFGPINHKFDKSALAVLDWGRGVWTYSNTWYWSSLNAVQDNHRIGFNLGYGFGDTSKASENMFFYDDKVYKLDNVTFNIPSIDDKDDYLSTWTFTSSDGAIFLTFEPLIDRKNKTSALIIESDQHQVFGYFTGTIKVDNKTFEIKHLLGFAEKVKNRW